MKNYYTTLTFLLLSTFLMGQSDNGFSTKWSNGYKVESANKDFKMKFGGRIMFDMAFIGQDDATEDEFGELKSGLEFRRARFFNSGQIYKNIKYKIQLDFAGKVSFKDVYIQIAKIPTIGNFRVGHFKEPFRLEALTSSKYITFMERSFHIPFSQERNSGAMIFNESKDKRIGWQLGAFRNGDGFGADKNTGGDVNITGRITGLLMKNTEKNSLLHVGAGFSSRSPEDDEYKVSSRPSAHLANKYLSTGTIENTERVTLINGEAAAVFGPFSIQGEYLSSGVNTDKTDYSFSAYYGQLSYFLTGEHRPYKNSYEGFDRIKPNNNAGNGEGGHGAWEIALRYGGINLNNEDVAGGEMSEITVGLNWYLNPATRFMANYVYADVVDLGKTSIFQLRFQVDF
ncbi:MAG: hypothetical protein GY705_15520 [Bacteroidetes bacterium]|nr:hypothetical protein [Bacteroidota bacterium]